jgi:catechol 2,3-dioxygenase-like lactoylglutathione lyase family enzyme
MTFTHIKETCLYVSDLDRTRAFYADLLGFEMIGHVPGRHVFFRVGQSVLLCFLPEVTAQETRLPPHFGSGQLHVAFECEKGAYDLRKAEIEQLGIPILQEYTWPNDVRSFYFHDPDLHLLEVVEPGLWD